MSANRMVVNNITINTHNVTVEKETEVYFHNKSRESSVSDGESVLHGQGTESLELLDVQRGTVTHYVGVN
jgi:hypothetical protein